MGSFFHWVLTHKTLSLADLSLLISEMLPFVSDKYKGIVQGILAYRKGKKAQA